MRIHREGYTIIAVAAVLLLAINIVLVFIVRAPLWLIVPVASVSLVKLAFFLYFFRAPHRSIAGGVNTVVSPADGKIVIVGETVEKEILKNSCLQVSVFMSPLNMHSNRYPVSGSVKMVNYHPGKYMVAWHPKSSELNERSSTVIVTENGTEILVRQIAGAVARRIVTYAKPGQKVIQGGELGFIKFGSRVDIFLPLGTEIEVPILQQVKANKSIIAKI